MKNTDPADGDRVHLHTEWAWYVCERQRETYTQTYTEIKRQRHGDGGREGIDRLPVATVY